MHTKARETTVMSSDSSQFTPLRNGDCSRRKEFALREVCNGMENTAYSLPNLGDLTDFS